MLTIQSVLSFFYSYLGWSWSRAAWQPGQITPLFFYSDEETIFRAFPYTPQIEATYLMFVVTFALLLFWVLASTLAGTAEVNEVEGDSNHAIRTGLLDHPDYVFFYRDTGEDIESDAYTLEEDEWLGEYPYGDYYEERDCSPFEYPLGTTSDFHALEKFNRWEEDIVDIDYTGMIDYGEPDDRLIWMYAYDEIYESRESDVHVFYPWDSDKYFYPDIVSWYYASTYDPLAGYFVVSLASGRN